MVFVKIPRTPADVIANLRGKPNLTEEEKARLAGAEGAARLNPSVLSEPSIFNLSNVQNDFLFWLLLLKLSKNDPKSVERILIHLFDSAGEALDAFCRAGSSNRISAWGSARLLSLYMERFGLITQPQAIDFINGLNVLTGLEVAEELSTLIPWKAFTPDIDFPQTVVLGSKTRQIRVVREGRPKKTTKITKKGELIVEES